MDARDAALSAIRHRLKQAQEAGDVSGLFSDQAVKDAEALARAIDPGEDLSASAPLGNFHWYRYLLLPEGDGQADFDAAVRLLFPVYQRYPQAVPTRLWLLFARARTTPGDAEVADEAARRAAQYFADFEDSGQIWSLDQAVDLFREALRATPEGHPDRGAHLVNLGTSLLTSFEQTGDVEALTEAMDVQRQAVLITPEGHADRAGYLSNLGATLQTSCERTGDVRGLAEAVEVGRQAVRATPTDHLDLAARLSSLGNALQAVFERTGDVEALAEAVDVQRQAVHAISENHPDRATVLSNFCGALQVLFRRRADVSLLAEAIDAGRQAVSATPERHPDYQGRLRNLCGALQVLYHRTGNIEALAEAVDVGRLAVRTVREDHPDRAAYLSNLGGMLLVLFDRFGDIGALAEAVDVGWLAVRAAPEDHPDRSAYLSNLSAALGTLFERVGDSELLAEAVDVGRQAVQAMPDDHPDRAACLNSLGSALQRQFERVGDAELLTEAVDVGRQAVQAMPEDHPNRAVCLHNLGAALQRQFEQTSDVGALVQAVEAGRQAVRARTEDQPDRAAYLHNLGRAVQRLSEAVGDVELLAEAADSCRSASRNTAAEVSVRVQAYFRLAALPASVVSPEEALDAVESAVALMPQISPHTLARNDREHRIGELGSLAAVAATAALNGGNPRRAVELLEATRGMLVVDSITAGGAEVARLRKAHPELADEFEDLRDRRETLGHAAVRPDPSRARPHSAIGSARDEDLGLARHQAQTQWDGLLSRIRALDGFDRFQAAPNLAELVVHAEPGPIVFLTAGPTRCDALIVVGDPDNPVHTIRLDRLTRHDVADRAHQLMAAQRLATERNLNPETGTLGQQEIHEVLAWLWDTVAEPVLAALGYTTTPRKDEGWPRIWWCPVGIMGYLPLHAAGHHRDLHSPDPAVKAAPRTVLDRVVSSYAPTIRALAYARSSSPADTRADAVLVVAVPDAPNTSPLPGVHAEADAVATLIPQAIRPERPVRAEVLAALPTHPIAHFACHGQADWDDPAGSRLILHDHRTSPLTVADITALHLTGTLAYLSACATSSVRPQLADEALHLTGSFHLAGYQNVIGTLWPVNDLSATRIAIDFYTHITHGGTAPADTAACAHALHHAIHALRADQPDTPTHWAAHTHTGI